MSEIPSQEVMRFTVTRQALEDYWAVYLLSFDEMNASAMRVVNSDPWFAPMLAALTPEAMAAQQTASRERLRKGIAGDWSDYVAALRSDGARFAEIGVPFRSWYDLLAAMNRALFPRLVQAYGSDPARLSDALRASQELIDSAMALLADTYVEAKQRMVDAQRARSDELERQGVLFREASRLKSEFLANMSHELRTPLNAILGFSELMRDGVAGPLTDRQADYLNDVLASGRHLLGLINDVLDLAKVEAGRLELHPMELHLPGLAADVLAVMRPNAVRKNLQIELDVEPDLPIVLLDPSRVKQVLFNYLSNAVKFTPEGGRVAVRIASVGPRAVRLEVTDTGQGISEANLSRLFREFEQVGSPGQSAEGTGLGLALTKRLVEAMGGSVGVTSRIGEGSTFSAVFPIRLARDAQAHPNVVVPGATVDSPRVLVVEDEPDDQAVLVRILTGQGYAVETVSTAAQALARLGEQPYDAITLDLVLPDAPGLDVLKGIRDGELNRTTPVIIVSVAAEEKLAVGYAVAGVLTKPISSVGLREALQNAGIAPRDTGVVMVVDDDPVSLRLATESLGELGFKPVSFSDPQAALEMMEHERPSAIILDLLMPKLDGFSFLERLRQQAAPAIPVFVWTVKDLTEGDLERLRLYAKTIVLDGKRSGSSLISELQALLPASARARTGT